MSICPFAVQQIIPESHTQGAITPTTLIFHEAVSSADSLQAYWNSPGNELECHFYIGRDGTLYQYVDTNVRADANVSANGFAISVETWDNGGDVNAQWNPAQLATAKRLAAWCRDEHGIPGRAPASWASGGIGGHNWFPAEWAGGPRDCPGPNRSAQIRNDIIPFVAGGGGTKEEDDVSAADVTQGLYDTRVDGRNLYDWFRQLRAEQGVIRDQLMGQIVGLQAAVTTLAAKVGGGGGASAAEIEAAVAQAIQDNVVKVDVSVGGQAAQ